MLYHPKPGTNNKRVISTFKFGITLKGGPRSNATTPEDSQHMISYMLVYHHKPLGPIIRVISTFKFGYALLTLNEGPKVKSDHTRRFPAHDFLYVGIPSQTSRTNNKRVIRTFKFGYARLTLKGGPKVKCDHSRRFPGHDFLYVGIPSQTSTTNNKRVQGLILAKFL